jgi:hypothetical protein
MRNRGLHDALRGFALQAAALLSEDERAGAELAFDVVDEPGRHRLPLYRYRPRIEQYIADRWERLRALPSCAPAASALGEGAERYLRELGGGITPGEPANAERALRAVLERLYEDATGFAFPEERFERVYRDLERTLYRDTVRVTVVAPLPGLVLEPTRVELGGGLALARGEECDAPAEAIWPEGGGEPRAICLLRRDCPPDAELPTTAAATLFRRLVLALRLLGPGGVTLDPLGWRRSDASRWRPVALRGTGHARGAPWTMGHGDAAELPRLLEALGAPLPARVRWALDRLESGCSRERDTDALSDYLLGLRGLLDGTSDAGAASLSLRVAALCAEEPERGAVRHQLELCLALERLAMSGRAGDDLAAALGHESPSALVAEAEARLRTLLCDVVCGYLANELKSVADDLLLRSPQPVDIAAREVRGGEPTDARDTEEMEAIPEDPVDGVTASADWAPVDDYSAPAGESPNR